MRFVLVHGGYHGAWCWQRLIPQLERRGHQAIAMDLPGHGARRDENATAAGYRDAVTEVLRPGDVLVGHSMGVWVAAMAADAFPDLRHIVFLSGPLPAEGQPLLSPALLAHLPNMAHVANHEGTSPRDFSIELDRDTAAATYYHDCTDEIIDWAYERLTPQQMGLLLLEPVSIPNFWASQPPRSFIRCLQDRGMTNEAYEDAIQRLGVVPLTINTSHSPFLSRPKELAEVLLAAVETTPIGPLSPR